MFAAIVDAFDHSPRYGDISAPAPRDGHVLVDVRAAALSQLVRAQASGRHYSGATPPFRRARYTMVVSMVRIT